MKKSAESYRTPPRGMTLRAPEIRQTPAPTVRRSAQTRRISAVSSYRSPRRRFLQGRKDFLSSLGSIPRKGLSPVFNLIKSQRSPSVEEVQDSGHFLPAKPFSFIHEGFRDGHPVVKKLPIHDIRLIGTAKWRVSPASGSVGNLHENNFTPLVQEQGTPVAPLDSNGATNAPHASE